MTYRSILQFIARCSDFLIAIVQSAKKAKVPIEAFDFLRKQEGETTLESIMELLKDNYNHYILTEESKSVRQDNNIKIIINNGEISSVIIDDYQKLRLDKTQLDSECWYKQSALDDIKEFVPISLSSMEGASTLADIYLYAEQQSLHLFSPRQCLSYASKEGYKMGTYSTPYMKGPKKYFATLPVNRVLEDGNYPCIFSIQIYENIDKKEVKILGVHDNITEIFRNQSNIEFMFYR